jgi:hypothetical protein
MCGSDTPFRLATTLARLAAHEGHFDPLGSLLGLAIMYVMARTFWAVMWNGV